MFKQGIEVVEPTQDVFGEYSDEMRRLTVDQIITQQYQAQQGKAKPRLVHRTGLRSLWYQLIMWGLSEK